MASRPPQSAASFTSPWSLTHSASTPAGTTSCGMPGAVLTQASPASSDSTNDHGGVQASSGEGPAAAGAPGRVGEGDVERAGCRRRARRRRRPRRAGPARRGSRSATATRTGSRSTPAAVEPGPRERDQVAADAAAEVDHGRGAERREPGRPVRGDREPGRLLEPVRREVHRRGELAELRRRPARAARPGSARPRAASGGVPGAARASAARARSGSGSSSGDGAARAPAGRRRSAATARSRRPRRPLPIPALALH